jgi:glc operon protein GlcG
MKRSAFVVLVLAGTLAAAGGAARAAPAPQPAPPPLPYGPPITQEQAKLVAAAAMAEAKRRNAAATIAIVDPAGELVYYEKATAASYTAEGLAMGKAKAAARTRRATKFDADRLAAGNLLVLKLPDVFPAGGGELIVADGKIIGAIGGTGGSDVEVASAGAAALK